MPKFTTRVELYGSPSESVYTKLHFAMKEKGFSRAITDNGKSYQLPHAEHVLSKQATTLEIVELAKQVASTVWKDFCVLVTNTEVRWEYFNLKKL